MPTVSVLSQTTGRLERSFKARSDPMPYNSGSTLTVNEFAGERNPIFTTTDTMTAFNTLRSAFGAPIRIVKGYLRPDGETSGGRPQHFAGTALLLYPLAGTVEDLLRANAASRAFPVAEKRGAYLYADCRYLPYPARITSGFPTLYKGLSNNYVGFLQRGLLDFGVFSGAVDGIFGPVTDTAVRAFQRSLHLTEDGVVSEDEWASLVALGDLS